MKKGRKPAIRKRKRVPAQREVALKPGTEVVLTPKEAPAKPPDDKRIHPRRPLPVVPEAAPDNERPGKSGSSTSASDR